MSQVEKEIEIKKIAKRMSLLIREVEVASLDIMINSTILSKDKFPTQYFKDTAKVMSDYATEMIRISEAWNRLFKEELEAVEQIAEPLKKRKRK
jgi:hypothetical protein